MDLQDDERFFFMTVEKFSSVTVNLGQKGRKVL